MEVEDGFLDIFSIQRARPRGDSEASNIIGVLTVQ